MNLIIHFKKYYINKIRNKSSKILNTNIIREKKDLY